jgi:hypothetical protein
MQITKLNTVDLFLLLMSGTVMDIPLQVNVSEINIRLARYLLYGLTYLKYIYYYASKKAIKN